MRVYRAGGYDIFIYSIYLELAMEPKYGFKLKNNYNELAPQQMFDKECDAEDAAEIKIKELAARNYIRELTRRAS